MLRWLIQEPGEPEAFKDSFEPLFANDCGDQRNGLLPMDGEADVRRLLKQEVQQGRKVSNVVAYGRDHIIGEIGRQIRIPGGSKSKSTSARFSIACRINSRCRLAFTESMNTASASFSRGKLLSSAMQAWMSPTELSRPTSARRALADLLFCTRIIAMLSGRRYIPTIQPNESAKLCAACAPPACLGRRTKPVRSGRRKPVSVDQIRDGRPNLANALRPLFRIRSLWLSSEYYGEAGKLRLSTMQGPAGAQLNVPGSNLESRASRCIATTSHPAKARPPLKLQPNLNSTP
ncbi:hypothetical protein ABIC07_009140 [Bradyrhizobium sp. RT9a]